MTEILYTPLPFQERFQDSDKQKVYLSAGYGAGKTYSLCMKMLKLCSQNAGLPGGILAPSLKMFKRDVLPTIQDICRENDIENPYRPSDGMLYFKETDSVVYIFHGEDRGRSIRGPSLAFMCINEVSLLEKEVFDAAIARVRLKDSPMLQVAMSGTPEGFNWVYEYFLEKPRTDTDFIFGDMRLNTFVDESYAQMLMESYDEKMIEQYVMGKFVNLRGNRAVYAFDRQRHLREIEEDKDLMVWVTMDFNVNPMTASLMNRMPVNYKHCLQVFDEIVLKDSNTYEMAKVLKERIGSDYVTIYPDPAGNSRSTSAKMNLTDIDILKQHGFRDIKFKSRITSVRDCLNALNNLFSKDKILISPKCTNLIADLEQCTIKQGTNDLDKADPKRTHSLDGLKNMADYEFPVIKSRSRVYDQRIR